MRGQPLSNPGFGLVVREDDGKGLFAEVRRAHTFWARLRGLLGRKSLGPEEGLWLERCNAIHMAGMRFAIDAIFLDREGRVVAVRENVRPWGIAGPVKGAREVLEVAAGSADRLQIKPGQGLRPAWKKERPPRQA